VVSVCLLFCCWRVEKKNSLVVGVIVMFLGRFSVVNRAIKGILWMYFSFLYQGFLSYVEFRMKMSYR
jgi:hypothetical protein